MGLDLEKEKERIWFWGKIFYRFVGREDKEGDICLAQLVSLIEIGDRSIRCKSWMKRKLETCKFTIFINYFAKHSSPNSSVNASIIN